MKHLLVDLDGVWADWHRGIAALFNVSFRWRELGSTGVASQNLGLDEIGVDMTTIWEYTDRAFWANLPLTAGAKDLASLIRESFTVEQVCVCTLIPWKYGLPLEKTAEVLNGKIDWLQTHFPQYASRLMFCTDKYFAAGPNQCLLDDCEETVAAFRRNDGYAILVPELWNSMHYMTGKPKLDHIRDGLERFRFME